MTHPPDVKGTKVDRAQTPSGPILAPSMTDTEFRINQNMVRESSIMFIILCSSPKFIAPREEFCSDRYRQKFCNQTIISWFHVDHLDRTLGFASLENAETLIALPVVTLVLVWISSECWYRVLEPKTCIRFFVQRASLAHAVSCMCYE